MRKLKSPFRKLTSLPPPTESAEQVALVARCLAATGKHRAARLIFAIPNGGARHIATARRLKAEGVRPGVPDLMLPVPRWREPHTGLLDPGLFIEMKRRKGGVVSPEQAAWHKTLRDQGYAVAVCRGADEAWSAITRYLDGGWS